MVISFSRPRDVVGGLQADPGLRRGAECLGEPDRHLGRHARTAIHQVREGLATDAQDLGAFGHAEAKRLQTSGTHDLAGVWRILHGHGMASFVSAATVSAVSGEGRAQSPFVFFSLGKETPIFPSGSFVNFGMGRAKSFISPRFCSQ